MDRLVRGKLGQKKPGPVFKIWVYYDCRSEINTHGVFLQIFWVLGGAFPRELFKKTELFGFFFTKNIISNFSCNTKTTMQENGTFVKFLWNFWAKISKYELFLFFMLKNGTFSLIFTQNREIIMFRTRKFRKRRCEKTDLLAKILRCLSENQQVWTVINFYVEKRNFFIDFLAKW